MRIGRRAWIARVVVSGTATAAAFASIAAFSNNRPAAADAFTVPYTVTQLAASGIESALAHGEAASLRVPQIAAATDCSSGLSISPAVRSGAGLEQDRRYYYDAKCTVVARIVSVEAGGVHGGTIVTATTYSAAGERIARRTTEYALGHSQGASTTRAASRLTAGTGNSVFALANVSWDENERGQVTSSLARVGDPQSSSLGVAVQAAGTVQTQSDGTRHVSAESSGPMFHGPAGGLALTLDAPYEIISAPQSRIGVESSHWDEAIDAGGLPVALRVHDGALSQGLHLEIVTENRRFLGTVSDGAGKALAHLNIDRFGDGLVRYADGSSNPIADWHSTSPLV